MEPIKLYLILNADIKFTPGQIASQVTHLTHLLTDEIVRAAYELYPIPEYYLNYAIWNKNPIVIIKRASENELNALRSLPFARSFYDEIYDKQFKRKNKCLTVVGFFPGSVSDDMMIDFKLL